MSTVRIRPEDSWRGMREESPETLRLRAQLERMGWDTYSEQVDRDLGRETRMSAVHREGGGVIQNTYLLGHNMPEWSLRTELEKRWRDIVSEAVEHAEGRRR